MKCGAHNPAASCVRVHLYRSRGGRGLDALTFVWEVEVLSSALYLKRVADQRVEGAVAFMEDNERKERKQTILGLAKQILERYRFFCSMLGVVETETGAEDDRPPVKVAKELTGQLKRTQQAGLLEEVYAKKIHGVYMRELDKPSVDKGLSVKWLVDGKVPQKVEGDIMAAQDGVTLTRRREVS